MQLNNPAQKNKKAKDGKNKCPMKKQLSSVVAWEVKQVMAAHSLMCGPPQQDEEIDPEKYIATIVHAAIAKMQME